MGTLIVFSSAGHLHELKRSDMHIYNNVRKWQAELDRSHYYALLAVTESDERWIVPSWVENVDRYLEMLDNMINANIGC